MVQLDGRAAGETDADGDEYLDGEERHVGGAEVAAAQLDEAPDGEDQRHGGRLRLYRLAGEAADDDEYDETGDQQDLHDVHGR